MREVLPAWQLMSYWRHQTNCLSKTMPSLRNDCPADPAQLSVAPDSADLSRRLGMGDLERKATLGTFCVVITTAKIQPFLEPDGLALEPSSKERTESHTQGNPAHKF